MHRQQIVDRRGRGRVAAVPARCDWQPVPTVVSIDGIRVHSHVPIPVLTTPEDVSDRPRPALFQFVLVVCCCFVAASCCFRCLLLLSLLFFRSWLCCRCCVKAHSRRKKSTTPTKAKSIQIRQISKMISALGFDTQLLPIERIGPDSLHSNARQTADENLSCR